MCFLALFTSRTDICLCTPLMLIAGIRCTLCVACKCVCHYWAGENLQLHCNNMLRFSQSRAFVQIKSSSSERVWVDCDKETLWCFTAIFRSTPIWRITTVDVGGNILLETYCCALNLACALQLSKGQMFQRLKACSCPAGQQHNSVYDGKIQHRSEFWAQRIGPHFFPFIVDLT